MKQSKIGQPMHTPAAQLLLNFEASGKTGNDFEHAVTEAIRGLGLPVARVGKVYLGDKRKFAEVDVPVESRGRHYSIHLKTSFRERWKQDDRTAMYSASLGLGHDHLLLFYKESAQHDLLACVQAAARTQAKSLGGLHVASILETVRMDEFLKQIVLGESLR